MTGHEHDLAASVAHARAVADAVLYEGYLLYPYRASSSKNQVRWQFGVLGPPSAVERGLGEAPTMSCDFLMRAGASAAEVPSVSAQLRFLHHQVRLVERRAADGFERVPELAVAGQRWMTWDEAVESEVELGPWSMAALQEGRLQEVSEPADRTEEELSDDAGEVIGRVVRTRSRLDAEVALTARDIGAGRWRVSLELRNVAPGAADKDAAIAMSLIGTHVVLVADGAEFLSSSDPPPDVVAEAGALTQHRCWPVLAGPVGETRILLITPIIVEDNAELAPQSAGALFDSTEIDEILTLRVMTMTDEEKAEARATDPRAAEIIDRCDQMTPQQMQDLHGILRNPHGVADPMASWPDALADLGAPGAELWAAPAMESFDLPESLVFTTDAPWWDPEADASVSPSTDSVMIDGVRVAAGSIVTVRPNRRADAQDLFYDGMTARVTAVLGDVDGDTHVAVVLVDDPAAELHDWYGRYLYFAPDELIPDAARTTAEHHSPQGDPP